MQVPYCILELKIDLFDATECPIARGPPPLPLRSEKPIHRYRFRRDFARFFRKPFAIRAVSSFESNAQLPRREKSSFHNVKKLS